MKKSLLFLLIVFLLAIPFVASANTIIVDGTFNTTEWAGQYADGDGIVGPGVGGQDYDVEFLGLYIESGTVYFGMQTGFDVVYGRDYGSSLHFSPGDFALDLGGDGVTYEYAIDFSIDQTTKAVSYYLINMSSATWKDPYYPQHSIAGPFEADYSQGDVVSTFTANGYGFTNDGDGDHYTLEGAFQLDLLGTNLNGETIAINWTMGCGNDYLNYKTTAPVPEPATMLLLGTGLIGLAGFGRKKFTNN